MSRRNDGGFSPPCAASPRMPGLLRRTRLARRRAPAAPLARRRQSAGRDNRARRRALSLPHLLCRAEADQLPMRRGRGRSCQSDGRPSARFGRLPRASAAHRSLRMAASTTPSASAARVSTSNRGDARRNELAAAGQIIEIFEDHRAVVNRPTVLQHQSRNLAERVLCSQTVVWVAGVGRDELDPICETKHRRSDANFSDKGRCGR